MIRASRLGCVAIIAAALSSVACSDAASEEVMPVDDNQNKNAQISPEEAERIHQRNEATLAASGLFYHLQAGVDHDIYFIEHEPNVLGILERVGPNAPSAQRDGNALSNASPVDIFKHFKPAEEVPAVLVDATARMYHDTSESAGEMVPVIPGDGEMDPGIPSSQGGFRPQHTTGDGNHFSNDNHGYGGGISDNGCASMSNQTFKVCFLNRTGGGFAEKKSTHVLAHFGIFAGGSTLWGYKRNGSLKWELTVMNGEIWRYADNGPWECPGLFCSYSGYTAVTHRIQWAGGGKDWHFGGSWADFFRN